MDDSLSQNKKRFTESGYEMIQSEYEGMGCLTHTHTHLAQEFRDVFGVLSLSRLWQKSVQTGRSLFLRHLLVFRLKSKQMFISMRVYPDTRVPRLI